MMKIDAYTKFVLTLIAIGLFWNAVRPDPISKAFAQSGGQFSVNLVVSNDSSSLGHRRPFEFQAMPSK